MKSISIPCVNLLDMNVNTVNNYFSRISLLKLVDYDYLLISCRRRMQQLKLWQQREKEWARTRPRKEKSTKRNIYFSDSVMLLEAAARNDIDEGTREYVFFVWMMHKSYKESDVSFRCCFACEVAFVFTSIKIVSLDQCCMRTAVKRLGCRNCFTNSQLSIQNGKVIAPWVPPQCGVCKTYHLKKLISCL